MQSFGARLSQFRGLGPGFDFLRIFLASMILVIHACWLAGDEYIRTSPFWFLEYALVPMFFALSGFLISASALRLNLKNFLINRGLRIIPALFVEVVICAIIIGPIFTTYSVKDYFGDKQVLQYFLNTTGWIHYQLPGLFKDHPTSQVNGALWSVPYEMVCYLLLSCLIVSGALKRPMQVSLSIILFVAIGLIGDHFPAYLPPAALQFVHFFFVSRGGQVLTAFLLGVIMYQLRNKIPYSWSIVLFCTCICAGGDILLKNADIEHVANRIILMPALVYVTLFIGLTEIPIPRVIRSGDYSYGVYLYHAPILQAIISLMPSVILVPRFGTAALIVIGIPAVALFAAFSWHTIEKPILGMRKKFSFVAKVRGVASTKDETIAPSLARSDLTKDFVS